VVEGVTSAVLSWATALSPRIALTPFDGSAACLLTPLLSSPPLSSLSSSPLHCNL
jgi:hypothetical protein